MAEEETKVEPAPEEPEPELPSQPPAELQQTTTDPEETALDLVLSKFEVEHDPGYISYFEDKVRENYGADQPPEEFDEKLKKGLVLTIWDLVTERSQLMLESLQAKKDLEEEKRKVKVFEQEISNYKEVQAKFEEERAALKKRIEELEKPAKPKEAPVPIVKKDPTVSLALVPKKEEKKAPISTEDDDFWKVVEEDTHKIGRGAKGGKLEQTLDLWINHPEKKKADTRKGDAKKIPQPSKGMQPKGKVQPQIKRK